MAHVLNRAAAVRPHIMQQLHGSDNTGNDNKNACVSSLPQINRDHPDTEL